MHCTGVETQSDPECDEGCEGDGGEKVACELVVAGGDAPEVLQPAECGLDAPASSVSGFVISDGRLAVRATWYHGRRAFGLQALAQRVGVIALVGEKTANRPRCVEEVCGHGDVRDVAGRQPQHGRAPQKVGHGMDLGGLAAARGADRLRLRPPLPPWAERCAFT